MNKDTKKQSISEWLENRFSTVVVLPKDCSVDVGKISKAVDENINQENIDE